MTDLDHRTGAPGYYASAWPAECGGPRRQKIVGPPGLHLGPGERLAATTRDVGGWAVMFVQRAPGELYLQGGAGLRSGEGAPHHRDGDAPGWVERVDPITLETVARSPDLPSGGWLWCGAIAVHANGDLYVVNGRYLHRLDANCRVVAERELPVDGPYNGLLIMSDGNIVTRNLGFRAGEAASFVVLEPDALEPVGSPLVLEERCMGRFSADRTAQGEHLYFTTDAHVRRLRYDSGELAVDDTWIATYAIDGADQSDAWDTTIGSDSVWLMDMGRPAGWMTPGTAPQRAFRFSIADPAQRDVFDTIGKPGAWNPGPPLYDPIRRVLVHYDAINGVVVAHRCDGPGSVVELWRRELHNFVQMLSWADSGELVVEDASTPGLEIGGPESEMVILDIGTGRELGRTGIGTPATLGMFCCPGFERDLYAASIPGGIARVFVAPNRT